MLKTFFSKVNYQIALGLLFGAYFIAQIVFRY